MHIFLFLPFEHSSANDTNLQLAEELFFFFFWPLIYRPVYAKLCQWAIFPIPSLNSTPAW